MFDFISHAYGAEDVFCYFLIHTQSVYDLIVLKNESGAKDPTPPGVVP